MKRYVLLLIVLGTSTLSPTCAAEVVQLAKTAFGMRTVFEAEAANSTGFQLFVEVGGSKVFDDLVFGPGVSAGSFVVDEAADADFASVAKVLTNGINDLLLFGGVFLPTGRGSAAGTGEFERFSGNDFVGNVVTSVVLEVDSLALTVTDTFGEATISARFIVVGQPIPEPAAAVLLGLGLTGLVLSGLWRGRSSA